MVFYQVEFHSIEETQIEHVAFTCYKLQGKAEAISLLFSFGSFSSVADF